MSPEGEARRAINCLLYQKLKHGVIRRIALCRETLQWDMMSGGRHYINNTFLLGDIVDCHPRGNIVNRGGAEVWQSTMSPRKNVIFILLYRMSHFYNKFNRREKLPCDIENCHPANWPIRLLEINMRYNKKVCLPCKCRLKTNQISWYVIFYVV